MFKPILFGVLFVALLSSGTVHSLNLRSTSQLVKRQAVVGPVCTLLGSLVNTLSTTVNYILLTLGNVITQARNLISAVKREVLQLGSDIAPLVISCLNGLLDTILNLPGLIKNELDVCVQGIVLSLSLSTGSLCASLAEVDTLLSTCFAPAETETIRCLLVGVLDFGGSLLEAVFNLLPMLGLLVAGLLNCADEIIGEVFVTLNTVINTDIDACRVVI